MNGVLTTSPHTLATETLHVFISASFTPDEVVLEQVAADPTPVNHAEYADGKCDTIRKLGDRPKA